ncbi:hypothetical protein NDU88_006910 [Pleurodeles waltl]|uniref:Uncharacterized protein n=1 Tax=Pleurodeles waltl TaxID=8319 RepID=A0AAV7SQU6_PLEWA|nr:hypothetical protein NDU88_006910 [Pleurodeles waltl]
MVPVRSQRTLCQLEQQRPISVSGFKLIVNRWRTGSSSSGPGCDIQEKGNTYRWLGLLIHPDNDESQDEVLPLLSQPQIWMSIEQQKEGHPEQIQQTTLSMHSLKKQTSTKQNKPQVLNSATNLEDPLLCEPAILSAFLFFTPFPLSPLVSKSSSYDETEKIMEYPKKQGVKVFVGDNPVVLWRSASSRGHVKQAEHVLQ